MALKFRLVGGFAHLSFGGCKHIYNFESILGLDTDAVLSKQSVLVSQYMFTHIYIDDFGTIVLLSEHCGPAWPESHGFGWAFNSSGF